MNRTLCTIIAIAIIAFAIAINVFLIASYSPTMLLTMSDRILLCAVWDALLGCMAYCIWDCRAL